MFSKKIKVTSGKGIRIKEKGTYDFNKIYKTLRNFFDEYNYDFDEKEQTIKDKEIGREIVIKWIAERKITDYMKYHIDTNLFLERIKPAPNKKSTGNFEITIESYITLDNKWEATFFGNFLFSIYNNFVIKRILIDHLDRLDMETKDFFNLAKSLF